MQRTKPPRHKLLNDMLRESRCDSHEDKHGKRVSRAKAKANKQCKRDIVEDMWYDTQPCHII